MKRIIFILLSTLAFFCPAAQDVGALIKEADRLEAVPDETAAYEKFKEVLKVKPTNLHALSKCSELCSRIGKRQKDHVLRDSYYTAAKIYAETALRIDSTNTEASCSMAIALGRSTMSKTGKEKMLNAKEIRKYIDISIKSDPNNFLAWHVLGRWHYEISSLNFLERSAVKIFYGGLPASSFQESVAAFEKSQALTPGFILNYYELARAYHRNGETPKAISTLKLLLTLPNHTEDDPAIKDDSKKMLALLEKFQ
jgi:tetratricopeptide (TPR) repeat protein